MKKKDFSYKKLEFYLQIYFVVYIKHPNVSSNQPRKDPDQDFQNS